MSGTYTRTFLGADSRIEASVTELTAVLRLDDVTLHFPIDPHALAKTVERIEAALLELRTAVPA